MGDQSENILVTFKRKRVIIIKTLLMLMRLPNIIVSLFQKFMKTNVKIKINIYVSVKRAITAKTNSSKLESFIDSVLVFPVPQTCFFFGTLTLE